MVRGTAEQRRAEVRREAAAAFSAVGLHGASVKTIAASVGISEAYVFRLFGSKRALFIDVVTTAFDEMSEGMAAAAEGATGTAALMLMGDRYMALLDNQQRLLLQMQGFAACSDAEVRDAVRRAFGRLWDRASAVSGLDALRVKTFISFGMLLNAMAAMDARGLDTDWARGAATPVVPSVYDFPGAAGGE